MPKSVVVVGAGPGGLAASMLLAHYGAQVTLIERQPQVGGRTSSIQHDGFTFDLGPTFFLYPQILEGIFQAVGRDLWKEVPMTRLDPQYRILFESGGELLATPNVEKLTQAVGSIAPQDAPNVRRFLDENRTKMREFAPCLQQPFNSWRDAANLRMLSLVPMLRPWQSLDSYLRRFFKDERIRLAFSFQSKYLGMSPFQCPSLFSILSFLEYEHGVFHPYGGCASISHAMARIAADMGVTIRLGESVEKVLFDNRRAVGVRTDQATYRADAVVMNADFARAMTSLVPDHLRRKWTDRKIAKKRFSCSTFMMYLGVEGRCDHLHHHNIFLAGNYKENLADIENRHTLSANPSFYVQNPCVTDDSMAPKNATALYVLLPVSHQHGNIDWAKEKAAFRATAYRQLEKLGLDKLERRVRFERIVTPADWDSTHNIHLGATFNLAHTFDQMLHLRPQNRFAELPGMYLVGGGTHPGSGLPVIFESAKITTKLLAEDLDLHAAPIVSTALPELGKLGELQEQTL